jgi:acyl-CoA thioesterase FadM
MILFFHDARVRYLRSLGKSEFDIGSGKGLIMTEARVRMKNVTFTGEEIVVGLGISEIGRIRFTVSFHAIRTSDGKTVAEGETTMACYDYRTHSTAKLPADFVKKISSSDTEVVL